MNFRVGTKTSQPARIPVGTAVYSAGEEKTYCHQTISGARVSVRNLNALTMVITGSSALRAMTRNVGNHWC